MQIVAEKYNKLYLKYTKSYGPFYGYLFRFLVKRSLNKLPFLLIRGNYNLKEIEKLKLSIPLYSFPDASLVLEPESREWAEDYIKKLGLDPCKKIIGLSPSSVIASIEERTGSSCGKLHLNLCQKIIDLYKKENQQILLFPHSIDDGKNEKDCDLALTRKFYNSLSDKKNIFLIEDMNLTYKQARAIIGLMDFYVTGRYHSVASALFMGVPVVSLSWHIKYKDIMSLFLDNPPIINCRDISVENALSLIKKHYYDRKWFDKEEILKKREEVSRDINKSIKLIADEVKKSLK